MNAAQNQELDLPREFVKAAFARSDVCHAVWDNNQMVSYAWRAQHYAPHNDNLAVRVPPGYSYGYKAFTLPDYRGRGLYPAIAALEVNNAVTNGLAKGISFTQFANLASLTADQKFGNQIVGIAGYWRMGKLYYIFSTPKVKRLGFAFVRVG